MDISLTDSSLCDIPMLTKSSHDDKSAIYGGIISDNNTNIDVFISSYMNRVMIIISMIINENIFPYSIH